jgi:hypothetical protein
VSNSASRRPDFAGDANAIAAVIIDVRCAHRLAAGVLSIAEAL